MNATPWQDQLGAQVRTLQIIIFALAFGSLLFATVVIFVGLKEQWHWDLSPIALIGLIFGGAILVARLAVPSAVVVQGRRQILQQLRGALEEDGETSGTATELDANVASQLRQLLSTRTIIGGALLDGVILFLLTASIMEDSLIALLAAGLLWLLLAAHFPTYGWAEQWMENQWRLLQEEQSLSRF